MGTEYHQPAAALVELAAGFAAQPLHACHQDAAPAAPAEPLAWRNWASEPHQASYQEQVAADIQIQADMEHIEYDYKFVAKLCKHIDQITRGEIKGCPR